MTINHDEAIDLVKIVVPDAECSFGMSRRAMNVVVGPVLLFVDDRGDGSVLVQRPKTNGQGGEQVQWARAISDKLEFTAVLMELLK